MALVHRTRVFDAPKKLRVFRVYAPLDGSRFVFMYRNNGEHHRKPKVWCSELIWFSFFMIWALSHLFLVNKAHTHTEREKESFVHWYYRHRIILNYPSKKYWQQHRCIKYWMIASHDTIRFIGIVVVVDNFWPTVYVQLIRKFSTIPTNIKAFHKNTFSAQWRSPTIKPHTQTHTHTSDSVPPKWRRKHVRACIHASSRQIFSRHTLMNVGSNHALMFMHK